ncbi:ribonuclease H-like domain-containing protein [Tanacetum coccineum]
MVPRAVLMKSGLVSINTARQNISKTVVLVNTVRQVNITHLKTTVNAARPMSYVSKTTRSTVKRPIHKNTTFKNSNINQKGNIVRGKKFNTARPKAVVNVVKGNNFNAVKASACWDQGVIDSGCSWAMTKEIVHITDYEEIDGDMLRLEGTQRRENSQRKSVAGTPQQNGVAKRRNRTLIEAARTMLADSKLLTTFGQKQLILLAISSRKEQYLSKINILIHLWIPDPPYSHRSKSSHDDWIQTSSGDDGNSTVDVAGTNKVNVVGGKTSIELPFDQNMHGLEDYSIFNFSRDDEDDGAVADMNNLDTTIQVSPNPTTRIHKDHPLDQVIRDFQLATQTRKMSKNLEEHGFKEPKKVILALKDPRWIEAMQEELLQFKLQEVWTLVDLPNGKRAIGSKWVYRNQECKHTNGNSKALLKDEDGEEVDVHMYRLPVNLRLHIFMHCEKGFLDEAVNKELGDGLVRAATTASSLEAEQG